jgi:hypothetical protein
MFFGKECIIERYVKSCGSYQAMANDLRVKMYGNWPSATNPFEKIHLSFKIPLSDNGKNTKMNTFYSLFVEAA